MERVSLEGRPAVRYHRKEAEGNYEVDQSLWLEPETGLLLRTEDMETDPRTGRVAQRTVADGYQYNQDPPPGVFDLPADKPLVVPDQDAVARDVTESLPADEREQIVQVINAANRAWQAGDAAAFARAWRFPLPPAQSVAPTRRDWLAQVRSQKGQWSRWEAAVVSITAAGFYGIAIGAHSFCLIQAPGVLWVATWLQTVQADTARVWQGEATYYLRRFKQGYRIVHWEYPAAEIGESL